MTLRTRFTFRAKGFARRAVLRDGREVGFVTSHLGLHRPFKLDGTLIMPPTPGHVGFELLRDAVAAVDTATRS
jgi:hypothetical protein